MKLIWKLLVVSALVAAGTVPVDPTARAADDAPYTIKLKHDPDVGKTVVIKKTDKQNGAFKVVDPDGKVLVDQKSNDVKEEKYSEAVLEKGDPDPKKLKRTYEKAVVTKGDKEAEQPFQGRTIIYELKDKKYEMTAEGKPALTEKDLSPIEKKPGREFENLVAPKDPVKVGGTWKIDIKEVAKALDKAFPADALDLAKSKAEGKLLKVYDKDGKKFGVLEIKITLAVKEADKIKFDPPLMFEIQGTLDTAIDGSSTAGKMVMTAKIKGKGVLENNGMKFSVDMDMTFGGDEERSAEK
jgi:hypothetical protein